MVSRQQLILREHHTLRAPWEAILNACGLLASLWLVALRVGASTEGPFLVILAGFAVTFWIATALSKQPTPYLQASSTAKFLAPSAAALGTLVVSALHRSFYSGTALALFVVVWTGWMLVTHLSVRRSAPHARALFIGPSPRYTALRQLRQLSITVLEAPPDTFDWDVVVIDPTKMYGDAWLQWLVHANMAGVSVTTVSSLIERVSGRIPTEVLDGRWAPTVFHGRSPYTFWKRLFDLTVTLLALPLLLPLGGIVALVVLFDGGRPVLFWQERTGKNGTPFRMVKFRSMHHDPKPNGGMLTVTASGGDPRITRVGAFLRKFRLDELPQFWNVLRGEMSIIGPRPEPSVLVEQFLQEIPLYAIRHHVRPGITGWSQVTQGYGQGTDDMREKLRCDAYYIKNLSLALDTRIVFKTVQTVLSGFGAR